MSEIQNATLPKEAKNQMRISVALIILMLLSAGVGHTADFNKLSDFTAIKDRVVTMRTSKGMTWDETCKELGPNEYSVLVNVVESSTIDKNRALALEILYRGYLCDLFNFDNLPLGRTRATIDTYIFIAKSPTPLSRFNIPTYENELIGIRNSCISATAEHLNSAANTIVAKQQYTNQTDTLIYLAIVDNEMAGDLAGIILNRCYDQYAYGDYMDRTFLGALISIAKNGGKNVSMYMVPKDAQQIFENSTFNY